MLRELRGQVQDYVCSMESQTSIGSDDGRLSGEGLGPAPSAGKPPRPQRPRSGSDRGRRSPVEGRTAAERDGAATPRSRQSFREIMELQPDLDLPEHQPVDFASHNSASLYH